MYIYTNFSSSVRYLKSYNIKFVHINLNSQIYAGFFEKLGTLKMTSEFESKPSFSI